MDHHTLAIAGISGIGLDVLGGLYLAYDLLGGPHGPLRLLTRMVTYSIVFGLGYGFGMGAFFGITSGLATGITIALELRRTARDQDHYPLGWEAFFSAIRGLGQAIPLWRIAGWKFGVTFAVLVTIGQVFAYTRGMRPGMKYTASRRPQLSRFQMIGVAVRTVGYMTGALIASIVAGDVAHPWALAIRVGLVTGGVTAVGIATVPFIEYYADSLPERRMGVFGIWLVLCGFLLQSVQYWVALMDIAVT